MNKADYPVRYFPLVNEFDNKLLTHFFNFLNSIPPDCVVELDLSSYGGSINVLFSILRIINDNPGRFTLIVSGLCDSAALDLVLMSNCEKIFLSSFIGGTMHNISMRADTRDLEDLTSDSNSRYKGYTKINKLMAKYFEKLEIDPDKIKLLRKGEDVFLTNTEIIKACKVKLANNIDFH